MKSKVKCDWIIAYDGSHGRNAYAVECKRCGVMQRFVTPISLDVYLAAIRAFQNIHANCKLEKVETT